MEDAQDLTQAYFARLLEKDFLGDVDARRGKFRSFLLASLSHFVANEWDRRRTLKRGGAVQFLSIDDLTKAEAEYARQTPELALTPEQIFVRNWALAVLRHAMARLETEFAAQGKAAVFEALKVFLTGEQEGARYAEIAATLGMTPGAARVAAHRLRERYRALLRAEIAQGLPAPVDPARVDEELQFLLAAL